MFGRFKPQRSNIFKSTPFSAEIAADVKTGSTVSAASGVSVDASCNQVITITCLQQLYNAVGFTPSAKDNSIGITGYLVSLRFYLFSIKPLMQYNCAGTICEHARSAILFR